MQKHSRICEYKKTYYFCSMQIEFDKEYLRELYQTGKTSDKKHRFQPQVIKGYKKLLMF